MRDALAAGIPVVSSVDDHESIRVVLGELDGPAHDAGVSLVVGCGLAPGLSDLLARHASTIFDEVVEIHVARTGIAGPASEVSVRRAMRDRALEWHDGVWRDTQHRVGHELVWFPDPVGACECDRVAGGVWCLAEAFPGSSLITQRWAAPPSRRLSILRRPPDTLTWGAARVEVTGTSGGVSNSVVYGVIERTAIAAGTTLALAALSVAGVLPGISDLLPVGVHGLASTSDAVAFLGELARRGVKAAVFEGVPVG